MRHYRNKWERCAPEQNTRDTIDIESFSGSRLIVLPYRYAGSLRCGWLGSYDVVTLFGPPSLVLPFKATSTLISSKLIVSSIRVVEDDKSQRIKLDKMEQRPALWSPDADD